MPCYVGDAADKAEMTGACVGLALRPSRIMVFPLSATTCMISQQLLNYNFRCQSIAQVYEGLQLSGFAPSPRALVH